AVDVSGWAQPSGTVSVDGSINAGDTGTVTIEDRSYTYTVVAGDTLNTVRDNLVALINGDPKGSAAASGSFTRILLHARLRGPAGNVIQFSAKNNDGGQLIMTAL